ncbi:MAG: alpha/beta hydrolase [Segetibacter sp.]|nr:alpha/beta hydrolase [Segetibacter sp.]
MENKFKYQDVDISYQVYGKGQPVVLLHGFAEDSTIWNEQVSFLQEHCLLILPDLPGSGKSPMLQKPEVGMEDYADCIKALIDHERVAECILLGHSMGGYVTLAFAEKYGDSLKGWGFIHSTASADNEEKKSARKKGISLIEKYGTYPFLKNSTPNLFSDNFKKQHPEKIEALIEQGKNFTKEALIQYYTAMMNRPERTLELKKTKVPVLFIIGSEDVAAPLKDLLNQVHVPKVSHIHLMNGIGHMSMIEAPGELNKYLMQFIKSAE